MPLRRLAAPVPAPLVLHGSSGVADAVIEEAIAAAMRKINVATALNTSYTMEGWTFLAEHGTATDPGEFCRARPRGYE